MEFPTQFYCATEDFSALDKMVPAPYIRRVFTLDQIPQAAELLITGLGFYEVYINGIHCTKGPLAPYISAPDDLIYFDQYDIARYLNTGKNVIGLLLGNGFQNEYAGIAWQFDSAPWRGAPQFSFVLEITTACQTLVIKADRDCKTAPSPILRDGIRAGECYDARQQQHGWNLPGFDDSAWQPCIPAKRPRGEMKICRAEPIAVRKEITPVSVQPHLDGYLYDFGVNAAGVCRLDIDAEAGQVLELYHGEFLANGVFNRRNLSYDDNDYKQKDIYITKNGHQTHTPRFTYHGFRYVYIKGLLPHQALPQTLTYLIMHSDLPQRGGFISSDDTVNRLQMATLVSDYANFFYYPNDCPHREKNGWTADVALSAEHMLLNFGAEKSFYEWLHNVRKAQNDFGSLPGIVPTGGWGYEWGNGPAWDCVIIHLPYFCYQYRGDKTVICDNAHAMLRYLSLLTTKIRPDGLIAFGLGDWLPASKVDCDAYDSPVAFTDTVVAMDMCQKAAYLFGEVGLKHHQTFAQGLYTQLRQAARIHLIDPNTMTALGHCQTSQAMGIYYNLFDEKEKPAAYARLLQIIEADGRMMTVGVLGGRVLFHVLAENGDAELALHMMTRPEFPSYGHWLLQGATSLYEDFTADMADNPCSFNHHIWGDISHFFYRHLAGIHYKTDQIALSIRPKFVSGIRFVSAWHEAPEGKISIEWNRQDDGTITLDIQSPPALQGDIRLEKDYLFENGSSSLPLLSGRYALNPIIANPIQ